MDVRQVTLTLRKVAKAAPLAAITALMFATALAASHHQRSPRAMKKRIANQTGSCGNALRTAAVVTSCPAGHVGIHRLGTSSDPLLGYRWLDRWQQCVHRREPWRLGHLEFRERQLVEHRPRDTSSLDRWE
jgi:hypothetical protein